MLLGDALGEQSDQQSEQNLCSSIVSENRDLGSSSFLVFPGVKMFELLVYIYAESFDSKTVWYLEPGPIQSVVSLILAPVSSMLFSYRPYRKLMMNCVMRWKPKRQQKKVSTIAVINAPE